MTTPATPSPCFGSRTVAFAGPCMWVKGTSCGVPGAGTSTRRDESASVFHTHLKADEYVKPVTVESLAAGETSETRTVLYGRDISPLVTRTCGVASGQ